MQHTPLVGLVAAPHTPFHADGTLNLAGVEKQAEHFLAQGVMQVFIAGTTGECHSLSLDERLKLAGRWMEVSRGTELRVVVHVGSNCLSDSKCLAAHAQQFGAAAVAAMAPSYFKPRDLETLIECCREVASAAPATPFYYYDIPSLTGVSCSMADLLEKGRARIPSLAGLKYTCSDLMGYQFCLRAKGGPFDVPWGFDEYLLAALALGARAAVGSTYNFAAPLYQRLWRAFSAGDLESAREEQFRSARLIRLLVRFGFFGSAKAVMAVVGVDVGPARLPNSNPTAEERALLRRELEQAGFFDWIRPGA